MTLSFLSHCAPLSHLIFYGGALCKPAQPGWGLGRLSQGEGSRFSPPLPPVPVGGRHCTRSSRAPRGLTELGVTRASMCCAHKRFSQLHAGEAALCRWRMSRHLVALCLSRLRQSIPNLWCSQREGCTEAPQAQSPSRQSKWGLVHQHSMAPKEKLAVSALMNINRIFHSESLQRSCLDHSIHNNSFMSLQIIKIGLESSMEVGMGLSVLCSGTLQVPLALVSPFLKSPKARARWGQ